MTRATKWALAVAACLLLAGVVLSAVALVQLGGFSFARLSTTEIKEKAHTVTDAFTAVQVDALTSDVTFAVSEDGTCKVVCKETENLYHTVQVNNGVLTVTANDQREWYDHIGIFFSEPSLVLHLPRQVYDRIEAKTATGDIMLDDMQVEGELTVETDTGDVSVSATSAYSCRVTVDTGDVVFKDVTVNGALETATATGDVQLLHTTAGSMRIGTSTGDVDLAASDAASIDMTTSAGDVHGILLSPKVFTADTSTGDVKVPANAGEQTCNVSTSTGDIWFEIQENG